MDTPQVLIIEDDRDTAEFFSTVLKIFGYEYEIITNAKTALARLASSIPDLILLDINLKQDIGGDDILFQIRSNPRLDHARVIVITAYLSLARPIMDLADLVLIKPIELDQLSVFIKRLNAYDFQPRRFIFRDPVSALYTKEFFLTRLELAFERSKRREDFLYAVLVISLEYTGDEDNEILSDAVQPLLRECSQRIRTNIRPTDTAARLGAWILGTLHEDLKAEGDVEIIRKRLQAALAIPFNIQRQEYLFDVRIGTEVNSSVFSSPSEILDLALQSIPEGPENPED